MAESTTPGTAARPPSGAHTATVPASRPPTSRPPANGAAHGPGLFARLRQALTPGKPVGPAVMAGPRWLRVGALRQGQLLGELVVPPQSGVTYGTDPGNHIVVAPPFVSPSAPLIVFQNGQYFLAFNTATTGFLASGPQKADLAHLRPQARPGPNGWFYLPIAETVQGRLVVADVALLFQFYHPPVGTRPGFFPAKGTGLPAQALPTVSKAATAPLAPVTTTPAAPPVAPPAPSVPAPAAARSAPVQAEPPPPVILPPPPEATQPLLRLGLIREGKLVQEHLVDGDRVVTLGRNPGNTFAVDDPAAPPEVSLVAAKDGKFTLLAYDWMSGRLRSGKQDADLRALMAAAQPAAPQGPRPIALPPDVNGKVAFGPYALLFHTVRAGAAPEARPRKAFPQAIRVGMVEGKKITQKALAAQPGRITVGTKGRCSLVVRGKNEPPKFVLFDARDNGFFVSLDPDVTGAFRAGAQVVDLAHIRQANPGVPYYPVPDNARGELRWHGRRFRFRFINSPRVMPFKPPKPDWEKSARKVAGIAAASVVAIQVAFLAWVNTLPPTNIVTDEDTKNPFAKLLMDKVAAQNPVKEAKEEVKTDPNSKEAAEAKKKEDKEPPKTAQEKKEQAQQKAQQSGLLKLLGGGSSVVNSLMAEVMGGGGAVIALDSAMAGLGSLGMGAGGGLGTLGGGGAGIATGIDSISTGGVAAGSEYTGKGVETVKAVTSMTGLVADGAVDKNQLSAYVKQRSAQVRACYEKALKANPSLAGKIVLSFTILTTGKAQNIAAEGDVGDPGVNQCIVASVKGWNMPKPEGEVDVSFSFVFSAG